MAGLAIKPKIEVAITLSLSEDEARALLALTAYGNKSFLEFFYKDMGQTELRPCEGGFTTLFDSVREVLPPLLRRCSMARDVFNGEVKQ